MNIFFFKSFYFISILIIKKKKNEINTEIFSDRDSISDNVDIVFGAVWPYVEENKIFNDENPLLSFSFIEFEPIFFFDLEKNDGILLIDDFFSFGWINVLIIFYLFKFYI